LNLILLLSLRKISGNEIFKIRLNQMIYMGSKYLVHNPCIMSLWLKVLFSGRNWQVDAETRGQTIVLESRHHRYIYIIYIYVSMVGTLCVKLRRLNHWRWWLDALWRLRAWQQKNWKLSHRGMTSDISLGHNRSVMKNKYDLDSGPGDVSTLVSIGSVADWFWFWRVLHRLKIRHCSAWRIYLWKTCQFESRFQGVLKF
jgi:hypothetical protein